MSIHWKCPKCGHEGCVVDEIHTTGGKFAKFFDVQNKRFTTLSCESCHYTEFYRAEIGDLENVLDFLIGG